jgi:alanine dehydrogenase
VTLILSEQDIERVLDLRGCVEVMEQTFADFGAGHAVNRPRTHAYSYVDPGTFYNFKSMDGGLPRLRVHALRISSEIIQMQRSFDRVREVKIPKAAGGRYVGLILLFDMETTEPLAIMQDAGIQRARVGATSALAAKYASRKDSKRIGLFGTGWQAPPQLEALSYVRDLDRVKVYSVDPEHRETFAKTMSAELGIPVVAVAEPREVVDEVDIVVCATNAREPVFRGEWLVAGQHVNSLQANEIDETTHQRADRIIVRASELSRHYVQKDSPEQPIQAQIAEFYDGKLGDKLIELGTIAAGMASGRETRDEITLFGGSGTGPSSGLGIQFAAVAKHVYDRARSLGLGNEIPTEWLTEVHHP